MNATAMISCMRISGVSMPGFILLAQPAFLPSAISSFFTQNEDIVLRELTIDHCRILQTDSYLLGKPKISTTYLLTPWTWPRTLSDQYRYHQMKSWLISAALQLGHKHMELVAVFLDFAVDNGHIRLPCDHHQIHHHHHNKDYLLDRKESSEIFCHWIGIHHLRCGTQCFPAWSWWNLLCLKERKAQHVIRLHTDTVVTLILVHVVCIIDLTSKPWPPYTLDVQGEWGGCFPTPRGLFQNFEGISCVIQDRRVQSLFVI